MMASHLREGEGRATSLISAIASPVRFAVRKYRDYKTKQRERARLNVTERELVDIQKKISRMLCTMDSQSNHQKQVTCCPCPDVIQTSATSRMTSSTACEQEACNRCVTGVCVRVCDQQCVICLNATATMRTEPCGHQVVCRRCFVATIQAAVTQRALPLRCVLCRTPILKLASSAGRPSSRSYLASPASRKVAPLDFRITNKTITSTSTATTTSSSSSKKDTAMHAGSAYLRARADETEVMEARRRCKWLTADEATAAAPPTATTEHLHHPQQQQLLMVPYLAIGGSGRHVIKRRVPPPSLVT